MCKSLSKLHYMQINSINLQARSLVLNVSTRAAIIRNARGGDSTRNSTSYHHAINILLLETCPRAHPHPLHTQMHTSYTTYTDYGTPYIMHVCTCETFHAPVWFRYFVDESGSGIGSPYDRKRNGCLKMLSIRRRRCEWCVMWAAVLHIYATIISGSTINSFEFYSF